MKLVCPVCQSEFPLEAALNDVAARQAVVKAFELTELGSLLIRYVTLFKPAKQALSMARLAKLLDELVPLIKQGQITRNGTIYAAPQAYWAQAIETMLMQRDKLSLPLKGHGYLQEIICSLADRTAAQKEKQTEQGRKYGAIHATQPQPVPARGISASVEAKASNAGAMVASAPRAAKATMPDSVKQTLNKLTGKRNA